MALIEHSGLHILDFLKKSKNKIKNKKCKRIK